MLFVEKWFFITMSGFLLEMSRNRMSVWYAHMYANFDSYKFIFQSVIEHCAHTYRKFKLKWNLVFEFFAYILTERNMTD